MIGKFISPSDRFTRTVFAVVMIVAFFLPWGRWLTLGLAILFLISAATGYCITCELYKLIWGECKECKIDKNLPTRTLKDKIY